MPGAQVKNWKMYEALRRERGYSKEKAARIANASVAKTRRKRHTRSRLRRAYRKTKGAR